MKIFFIQILIFFSSFLYAQNIKNYIKEYKDIAIHEMHKYNIPASITLAQAILESGSGLSKLATEANNHFGIKCHVDWNGLKIYHDDDEKNECFRKYDNVWDSFRDHSVFLSERKRYSFLFDLRKHDYKGWAKGLQKAGYATNKKYAKKLISLIQDYNLDQFDKKKLNKRKNKQFFEEDTPIEISNVYEKNYTKYVLAKVGEKYDDIAAQHDLWLWELLKYNESKVDRVLVEGEKVYLQPKRNKGTKSYHVVSEGENMYKISQLYGIKLKKLYKKNRMGLGSEPYIGQKINLIKKVSNR